MSLWKELKKYAGLGGTVVGGALGGPTGAIIGGTLGGAVSNSGGKGQQTGNSTSGWNNLPPEMKEAYLQTYLPDALRYYKAGPNEYQNIANKSLGSGLKGLAEEMPYFMDFYNDNVSNRVLRGMEEDAARKRTDIQSHFAKNGGLGGLFGTALGTELGLLNKNTANMVSDYKHDMANAAFNSALGLRRQTLQDMMTAGDQPYNHISRLGNLLGVFPQGSTSTSQIPGQPTNWGNVLSGAYMAANAAGYNPFGSANSNIPPWQGGGGYTGGGFGGW